MHISSLLVLLLFASLLPKIFVRLWYSYLPSIGVCLPCKQKQHRHEERRNYGKVIPLEPNRALPEYEDIVFGAFFICGDDGENFCSLTDRQVQRYLERFRQPEIIFDSPVGIVAMPCGPDQYARFMQAARGDGGGEPPARRNRPTR